MALTDIGKELKRLYPNGVAKDGRKYTDINDEEIGSMIVGKKGLKGATDFVGLQEEPVEKEAAAAKIKLTGLGESGIQGIKDAREIYSKNPDVLTKQLLPGKFASRKFDSAMFNAVDAMLRIRTGAAAPEKEVRRYMKSLGPWFGDNPDVVEFKFKQLEDSLARETGSPMPERAEEEKVATAPTQIPPQLQAVLGALPAAGGIAGGIVGGMIPGAGQIPGVRGAVSGAGVASGQRLQQVLRGEAPQEAYQFGPAGRGLTGKEMGQVGGGVLIDLLFRGGGELLKKGLKAKTTPETLMEGLKTAEKGGKIRDAAIKKSQDAGGKVDGNIVFSSIKEWAKNAKRGASTTAKKQVDDFVKSASRSYKGKKLNPTTAKKAWDFANKAFSTAGTAGKTIESTYHRAVRGGVRKALDKAAPGFEKGTKLIREGLSLEKVLKTVRVGTERKELRKGLVSPIGKVAGKAAGVGGIYYLLNLLRGKG